MGKIVEQTNGIRPLEIIMLKLSVCHTGKSHFIH